MTKMTKTDLKYLGGLCLLTSILGGLFAAYGDAKRDEGAMAFGLMMKRVADVELKF